MRRELSKIPSPILFHHVLAIYVWQCSKWIDCYEYRACVRVDGIQDISAIQIVQHTGLIEVRQGRHVLHRSDLRDESMVSVSKLSW